MSSVGLASACVSNVLHADADVNVPRVSRRATAPPVLLP